MTNRKVLHDIHCRRNFFEEQNGYEIVAQQLKNFLKTFYIFSKETMLTAKHKHLI